MVDSEGSGGVGAGSTCSDGILGRGRGRDASARPEIPERRGLLSAALAARRRAMHRLTMVRGVRRFPVAVAVSLLLLQGTAQALPGDPPITAQAPLDGAVVPANDGGITVRFTCPAYTSRAGDGIFGPEAGLLSDYGAAFSDSAGLGADGRLQVRSAAGRVDAVAGGDGCEATLGSAGYPKPQSTPGTYFWQAWRTCYSCDGGFETGPVVRFVIRAAGRPTLTAPARAYAGYPFVAKVGYPTSGSTVFTVERKTASGWQTLGTPTAEGEPLLRLPLGVQHLRAVVRIGADTLTSTVQTVSVAAARRWTTSAQDDGTYRDAARPSVRLSVRDRGHRITGLRADVPTLCGAAGTPNISTVELPPVRIAPDGRFAIQGTFAGSSVRLVGRLAGRRLRATHLSIGSGSCTGGIDIDARHSGAVSR